jgi:hypothetical protein
MKPSDCTVTFLDNGLFIDFCLSVAPHFKKAYYSTPWINSFPKSNQLLPGVGFDTMERPKWVWDAIEKSDLIVFPDVYYGDLQEYLVRRGKLVWGSRKGEILETDRMKAKEIMAEYGVQGTPADEVVGLDDLRDYLKDHENVWVKISATRGDMETFKSENYEMSMPKLDELEHNLGAKKYIERFIIEPDISPAVEWGPDTFTIDGKWPQNFFCGTEVKDLGDAGRVMKWNELPQYLRDPNEKMSEWFKQQQYRGLYSTELRITPSRETFLIDPTCRAPSPPNEIQQLVFDNWADIFLAGASGKLVEPNPVHKYGVCAMIHSAWADKNWQSIQFPEEISQYVKIRNHTVIDSVHYCVPSEVGLPEVGAVVGVGETMDEAIAHMEDNAEQIKGYYLDIKIDGVARAKEECEKMEELGVDILGG